MPPKYRPNIALPPVTAPQCSSGALNNGGNILVSNNNNNNDYQTASMNPKLLYVE